MRTLFRTRYAVLLLALVTGLACETVASLAEEIVEGEEAPEDQAGAPESEAIKIDPVVSPRQPRSPTLVESKWDLWSNGETLLRGANIWQARVILDLDGPDFKGDGPVGPPYTQEDFNRLASFGANYVTVSGPGLFTEDPPYQLDPDVAAYWDDLLEMIGRADLFATIAFRTGPGRSEFNLCCGGDDYYDGYFNDSVWEEPEAQEAWVDMWRATAERYSSNPIVVGYKLMVEPNAEAVYFDVYEPEEFYPEYAGTTLDWNQFYPRIIDGIRSVDGETPILVGAAGFSAIHWLPYLTPVDRPGIVYVAHQYAPYEEYTHQGPRGRNSYPDELDLDYDGEPDRFDRQWLAGLLSPLVGYADAHGAPIAVDEFGVIRWVPEGAAYMSDLMDMFEERGFNYSLWEWQTSWPEFREEVHAFDFRFGPDPDSRSEVDNELLETIVDHWQLNAIRPSTVPWGAAAVED